MQWSWAFNLVCEMALSWNLEDNPNPNSREWLRPQFKKSIVGERAETACVHTLGLMMERAICLGFTNEFARNYENSMNP